MTRLDQCREAVTNAENELIKLGVPESSRRFILGQIKNAHYCLERSEQMHEDEFVYLRQVHGIDVSEQRKGFMRWEADHRDIKILKEAYAKIDGRHLSDDPAELERRRQDALKQLI